MMALMSAAFSLRDFARNGTGRRQFDSEGAVNTLTI
jgi:hypothetical protein